MNTRVTHFNHTHATVAGIARCDQKFTAMQKMFVSVKTTGSAVNGYNVTVMQTMCTVCGAAVLDKKLHFKFHSK